MKNESNNEVRIIDENYAKKYYDSVQEMMSERLQDISLEGHEEQIRDIFKSFLNFLKRKLFDNTDEIPNPDYESQQDQSQQQDYFQQLPDPNSSDFQEQIEQAISELLNQLLQSEKSQQQDSQQQENMNMDLNGQQQENQQQDSQQQEKNQQQNENIQKALETLVDKKDKKSVKEVDDSYQNGDENQQQDSQQQESMDMDLNGQQQGNQQQDSQQQDGQQQNENIQKALGTLVNKNSPSEGDGENSEQQEDGYNPDDSGQPNLDEETPVNATYSDSDELTKLNVDWTDDSTPHRRSERIRNYDQSRTEDELLKAIMKYLVKTNYYVKTYGLDKKNRKQIAKHFLLGLEHKIMTDTYSDVKEPLSFYIDMKGQCDELSKYNDFFRKLLNEKDLTIYFGYGGKLVKYLKVKRSNANLDFDRCDMCHYFQNSNALPVDADTDGYYETKVFAEPQQLEDFIRTHRLSRLVVFSDFDAANSVIRSSNISKIYWFCTTRYNGDIESSDYSLNDFKGEFIIARDLSDVMEYFEHINEPSYENKQRKLQLRRY